MVPKKYPEIILECKRILSRDKKKQNLSDLKMYIKIVCLESEKSLFEQISASYAEINPNLSMGLIWTHFVPLLDKKFDFENMVFLEIVLFFLCLNINICFASIKNM